MTQVERVLLMRAIFSLLVIVLAALYKGSIWNFTAQTKKEMNELAAHTRGAGPETELEDLPRPVQKWLKSSGAAGRTAIRIVRLKQTGWMKLKPEQQKWTPAEAEQLITTDPPSFIWTVKMKMKPYMTVIGKDSFHEGKAQLLIKLAALVPVAQISANSKTNESSLQRYLMEMAWYPTAAFLPYITWEELDEHTAEATMSYGGAKGSAVFHVDGEGCLVKIVANRFKDNDENAQRLPCVAEIKEHTEVDGILVPSKIEITWLLEEGPFTWYKFKVHDMEFR